MNKKELIHKYQIRELYINNSFFEKSDEIFKLPDEEVLLVKLVNDKNQKKEIYLNGRDFTIKFYSDGSLYRFITCITLEGMVECLEEISIEDALTMIEADDEEFKKFHGASSQNYETIMRSIENMKKIIHRELEEESEELISYSFLGSQREIYLMSGADKTYGVELELSINLEEHSFDIYLLCSNRVYRKVYFEDLEDLTRYLNRLDFYDFWNMIDFSKEDFEEWYGGEQFISPTEFDLLPSEDCTRYNLSN